MGYSNEVLEGRPLSREVLGQDGYSAHFFVEDGGSDSGILLLGSNQEFLSGPSVVSTN